MGKRGYKFSEDGERVFDEEGEPTYEDSVPEAPKQPPVSSQFARQLRITGKRLEPYSKSIDSLANVHGISPHLIRALASIESTGSQKDLRTGQTLRSPVGALGMMQLMPATAQEMKVDPHNDRQNLAGGAGYLAKMVKKFGGDTDKGVAAYNAGAGTVFRLTKKYGDKWKDHLPLETKNYVTNARQYFNAYGGSDAQAVEPDPEAPLVSEGDLLGKRYDNPNYDPKITKANQLFDDPQAQDREVQQEQKRGFRNNSRADQTLAGVGRWAYGIPGVGAAYNKLTKTGSSVADEDAVYRRGSAGRGLEDLGEVIPDIAAMAAGGGIATGMARRAGMSGMKKAAAIGFASGAPSAAFHQSQNLARGEKVDPVAGLAEVGLSTLAGPAGLKVSNYMKAKAPEILQKAINPTLEQMDQANPPNFGEALGQQMSPEDIAEYAKKAQGGFITNPFYKATQKATPTIAPDSNLDKYLRSLAEEPFRPKPTVVAPKTLSPYTGSVERRSLDMSSMTHRGPELRNAFRNMVEANKAQPMIDEAKVANLKYMAMQRGSVTNPLENLNTGLVPYFGGTREMEKRIGAKLGRLGTNRDASASAASLHPETNEVRRSVNVHTGVIPKATQELDAMMADPKQKLIKAVHGEAKEAMDYWKDQASARSTNKGGWMSVEDAIGLRKAIDDQVSFRRGNKTMTKGFDIASKIMRNKMNDYVRQVAPEVAGHTDEMAKLQPLYEALQRRNVKTPSFFTPFDYAQMASGAGLTALAPGASKAVPIGAAASALALRKLSTTVGGAAMLSDMGNSLGRSSGLRDLLAQTLRSGISKGREKK